MEYFFKTIDILTNFVLGFGKIISDSKPISIADRVIISENEHNVIQTLLDNKPLPTDDKHEVYILDNLDGTYTYVEVEIIEENY